MTIWPHQEAKTLILHSDLGCQLTRGDYQRFPDQNDWVSSMRSVGHCGDNAACEGCFGVLKRKRIHHRRYRTLTDARADVFDRTERFDNPRMRRGVAAQDQQFSAVIEPSVETG